MENKKLHREYPSYYYTARLDIEKNSKTQGECILVLSNQYISNDYCEHLWIHDMVSSCGFLDSDLYHSLMSEYSFPIYGINFSLPDDVELEHFPSDRNEKGYRPKFSPVIQAPFTLFCDFLAIDVQKFISELVNYLLNTSKLYQTNEIVDKNLLKRKYAPFSQMIMLDDIIEGHLELEKTKEYKQLSYEEAHLFLTKTYENAWFDFILLQKYCEAYINQPSLYGAPGYFDSFRQRYQIFDYYPVHGKMNENAELEKRLLREHYSNKDSNGFDSSFHEFTKKIPTLKKKTIVASNFSVFLSDMLKMIIENGYTIKKCKLCGQYFVPIGNNNIEYCSRIREGKQTCRDIGPKQHSQNKLKNDKVKNELKRIYNRLRNQKERHPEQPEYEKQFEEFKQKSKQLEYSYRAGELSESEMMSALDIWKAR